MKSNKLKFLCAVMALTLAFSSCMVANPGGTSSPADSSTGSSDSSVVTPPAAALTISQTEISLFVGDTATLSVSGVEGTATWLSSAETVATVVNGVVTGIAEGTAYITAKIGDSEATCRVIVAEEAVVVPTLVLDKISTEVGKGFSLTVTPYVQIGMEFTALDKTAVTWETSDSTIATVTNGVVNGVKEGSATITAKYTHEGAELTATASFQIVNINYHKAYLGDNEITAINPVKVVVADEYFESTSTSTATVKVMETDIITGAQTDVTSDITWQSVNPEIATASGSTVRGVRQNGSTELIGTLDGKEVVRVSVDGWTEITTKTQMDELALVTWKLRSGEENIAKMEQLLDGNYVLGADIDYNGEFILPIANTAPDRARMDNFPIGLISYCSWVWEDILEPITPEEEWAALNFNAANSTFNGSNPLNKPFTGEFDGNGYAIKNAQILDVNHLYAYRGSNPGQRFTAGGGCFIGTNEGTVKSIDFEGLRYRRHYAKTAAERDTKLTQDEFQIYCASTSSKLPYSDSVANTTNAALVRNNKGTLSDIRISAYYVSSYSEWEKMDTKQTTGSALGVCYNEPTGVVNNMVIILKKGEIPYLAYDNDPTTFDRGSYIGGTSDYSNYIFYSYNEGTIQNSLYLSEVIEGQSVQCTLTSQKTYWHSVTYTRHYGEDGQVGQLGGITGSVGIVQNTGAFYPSFAEPSLWEVFNHAGFVLDSYAEEYWDTQAMTMKKGVWNV